MTVITSALHEEVYEYTAEEIAELEATADMDERADNGYLDAIPECCEGCGDAMPTGAVQIGGSWYCAPCEWEAVADHNAAMGEWMDAQLGEAS